MATAHQKPDRGHRFRNSLEACRFYARPKRGRLVLEAKAAKPADAAIPLPDEPEFNEETKRALRESMAGEGLVRHDGMEDFFAAHGL